MKTNLSITAMIIFLIISCIDPVNAQVQLDVETGALFTGYNDVRIPGDQGTRFSLKDDFDAKPGVFYRIRLNYSINQRNTLSLLYAPLKTESEGRVPNDISFAGVLFPANTDLTGTYKFNSYRLTYRYEIVQKPKFNFGLGLTAKIRDAKIALASSELTGEKTNVGFVPIINFRMLWNVSEKAGLLIDGDALAAKQGRAEDVLIAATYRVSDLLGLKAGYRILEGGADNAEVYGFALFHYASFGFFMNF